MPVWLIVISHRMPPLHEDMAAFFLPGHIRFTLRQRRVGGVFFPCLCSLPCHTSLLFSHAADQAAKDFTMTRDELARIALRYDTQIADAMLKALGVVRPPRKGRTRDRHAKSRKYRGARKLMKQKHGVRL